MARFFLDLNECGALTLDEEGVVRKDLTEARDAALRAAREIMAAEIVEGRLCLSCHVDIRDESGGIVMTVPFKDAVTISGA